MSRSYGDASGFSNGWVVKRVLWAHLFVQVLSQEQFSAFQHRQRDHNVTTIVVVNAVVLFGALVVSNFL